MEASLISSILRITILDSAEVATFSASPDYMAFSGVLGSAAVPVATSPAGVSADALVNRVANFAEANNAGTKAEPAPVAQRVEPRISDRRPPPPPYGVDAAYPVPPTGGAGSTDAAAATPTMTVTQQPGSMYVTAPALSALRASGGRRTTPSNSMPARPPTLATNQQATPPQHGVPRPVVSPPAMMTQSAVVQPAPVRWIGGGGGGADPGSVSGAAMTSSLLFQRLEPLSQPLTDTWWATTFGPGVEEVEWAVFVAMLDRGSFHATGSARDGLLTERDVANLRAVLVPGELTTVARKLYAQLIAVIGPLTELSLAVLADLFDNHGFLPHTDRESSVHLLTGQPVGTYLTRFSQSQTNCFIAAYVGTAGTVVQSKIAASARGFTADQGVTFFPTAPRLVRARVVIV